MPRAIILDADGRTDFEFIESELKISFWLGELSTGEVIHQLDRADLKRVFDKFGADEKKALQQQRLLGRTHYSNSVRSKAIKLIWDIRYKLYREFCEKFVRDYELSHLKDLPEVTFPSGRKSKTEGMRGFLADMTSFAYAREGEYSYSDLKQRLIAQVENGKLIEAGVYEKSAKRRIIIYGYNDDKPFTPASYPHEFPEEAWDFMKHWENE